MRLGVVGNGVVGSAMARCFMEHAEVRVYDLLPERRTHPLADVLDSDLVFICLPSPQSRTSLECDTSAIEAFFRSVEGQQTRFVLRSTVPIGFTRRMRDKYGLTNIVHSPEFLTARAAIVDAQIPARNIIGYPGCDFPPYPPLAGGKVPLAALANLYAKRFPGVPIHYMSSDESEAVKLGLNSLFALKVAAFNELEAFCTTRGLDWNRVRDGILSDGRLAHAHTQVPGPDGKYGFGGECLPKDLASMVHQLGEGGMVFNAALRRNEAIDRQRKV